MASEKRDLTKDEPPIQRIILYIDDLDRCQPDRVVEVLEAVHLLLAFPLFIVVVGVDPRWLRHSLAQHYGQTLMHGELADAATDQGNNIRYATPQDYLEKIFQIPFALRPVDETGYQKLVGNLLTPMSRARPTDGHTGEERSTDPSRPATASAEAGDAERVERFTPAPAAAIEEERPDGPQSAEAEIDVAGAEPDSTAAAPLPTDQEEPAIGLDGGHESYPETDDADSLEAAPERIEPQGFGLPPIDAEPVPEEAFTPLNEEQLAFQKWEIADIERLWPLFRTPRSIKRFINIYRLLRAGLPDRNAVERFEGTEQEPGQYQPALLLLAVVTAFPNESDRFLEALKNWLNETTDGPFDDRTVHSWADFLDSLGGNGPQAAERGSAATDSDKNDEDVDEWVYLCTSLNQVTQDSFSKAFTRGEALSWAKRVSRYSFSTQYASWIDDREQKNGYLLHRSS